MKKTILSIAIALVTIISTNAQSKKSEVNFGVRGNCGMCKSTIEKAVSSLEGVSSATWDRENKKINISYDGTKTNLMELHTTIANTGYDTDMSKGNDEAYKNLHGCCQYDRNMKMSLKPKKDDHSGHKH